MTTSNLNTAIALVATEKQLDDVLRPMVAIMLSFAKKNMGTPAYMTVGDMFINVNTLADFNTDLIVDSLIKLFNEQDPYDSPYHFDEILFNLNQPHWSFDQITGFLTISEAEMATPFSNEPDVETHQLKIRMSEVCDSYCRIDFMRKLISVITTTSDNVFATIETKVGDITSENKVGNYSKDSLIYDIHNAAELVNKVPTFVLLENQQVTLAVQTINVN